MRKITYEAVNSFLDWIPYKKDNTQVYNSPDEVMLCLHGNPIAKIVKGDSMYITNAGWKTNTTKERLNGLLAQMKRDKIRQVKGVWFLGNKVMPDSTWIDIHTFNKHNRNSANT